MQDRSPPPTVTRARLPFTVVAVALLVSAVVTTLLCFDITGTRGPRPPWFFVLPALCGLLGAAAGLVARRTGLAVVTGVVGFFALPAAIVGTTLVAGP